MMMHMKMYVYSSYFVGRCELCFCFRDVLDFSQYMFGSQTILVMLVMMAAHLSETCSRQMYHTRNGK